MTMNAFPEVISEFLFDHHVVSLAAFSQDEVWCASCFYAFDPVEVRLIVLSSKTSHHGELMLRNPMIAGTIAGQPENVREICGIQFSASAECLVDKNRHKDALSLYTDIHPLAKMFVSDVWSIQLNSVKYTSNKFFFGQKTRWERSPQ